MMDLLLGMFIGWVFVSVIVFLFGLVKYADARPGDQMTKRMGARMIFGAPLWPVVGFVLASRNIRQVWRDADWEKLK